MNTLFGIALLFGLFIWIFIDLRRVRKSEAPIIDKAQGWDKDSKALQHSRRAGFGLSIFFYVVAIVDWHHPPEPPFKGYRFIQNFLYEELYYLFGPKGIAYFWALIATALLLLLFLRRRAVSQPVPITHR